MSEDYIDITAVAVLEARKLKKMDITGASDPYVKIKLFDSKVIRISRSVTLQNVKKKLIHA